MGGGISKRTLVIMDIIIQMQILKKKAYRIAGNFLWVKYLLFSRNFNIGVAYRNVRMKCSHETKRNFYSQIPPFFELNEFFTPRKLPAIRYSPYYTEHSNTFEQKHNMARSRDISTAQLAAFVLKVVAYKRDQMSYWVEWWGISPKWISLKEIYCTCTVIIIIPVQ